MNRIFKVVFAIFLFVFAHKGFAQNEINIPVTGDWESAGTIFQDENVIVELEFKLSKESCDTSSFGNSNHLFRYLITGLKKPLGFDKYVTFKIVYQDCYGRLICKTNNLNIGVKKKNDVWDGVQPISDPNSDNFFRGSKLVIPFMEVRTSLQKDPSKDSECYKKTVTIPAGVRSKKQPNQEQLTVNKSQENTPQVNTESSQFKVNGLQEKPKEPDKKSLEKFNEVPVSKSKKNDLRIKGPQGNIVKGQKIRLELSDPGDNEWNWYEESCNGTLLKTGSSFLDIIVLESTTFYAKPIVKISNVDICLNYHIFVDSTASLSVAPTNIVVNNKGIVCKGDTAKLYPIGGSLGTDAAWNWFEKGNPVPIFIGDTLKIVPEKSVNIILQAKGKFNETQGIETPITVYDFDFPNRKMVFSLEQSFCPNQLVKIKMEGPVSPIPMKWDWESQDNVMLSQGTESIIFSSPANAEIYATYKGCAEPKIYSRTYEVNTGSSLPSSYSFKQTGSLFKIDLKGGDLKYGSSWVLYDESNKRLKAFSTKDFTTDVVSKKYMIRAEGNCDTTNFLKLEISEKNKESNRFYINAGISVYPGSPKISEKTLTGTIGVLNTKGGWFLMIKKDIKEDASQYTTSNTSLLDFNNSSNYYLFNQEVLTNRLSVIFGLHSRIAQGLYWNIGAGYGKRDLIWGVNVKSANDGTFVNKAYAKNTTSSQSGAEVLTGLLVNAGPINFRVDASLTAGGFSSEKIYSEFTVGAGFTF
ncbi:MAG: hypothetical protein RJA76_1061 [Bacteroidota bacterium]|jgi:hypothetical protein